MSPGGPQWTHAEKPRNLWAAMGAFLRYIGPHRKEIALGVVCSLLASVLTLIGPQYLAGITDSLSLSVLESLPIDTGYITTTGILLIFIYIAGLIFSTMENYIIAASSEKIGARMRTDISKKLSRLPLSKLDNNSTGDLMSRMTNDTDTISNSCSESISQTVNAVTMFAGALLMMVYTDWRLAVFAVIPPVVGFIILFTITRRTQKYFIAQQRDLGRMNGLVEETYYGHDIVSVYNNHARIGRKFTEINDSLFNSAYKARVITGLVPQMMNFISNISYVVVCVVGSMMIVEGAIGYGVIVAFILYVRHFTHPIVMIADSVAMMQSVASASERIFELLNAEEMDDSPVEAVLDPSDVEGDVRFIDVRFGYVPGREIIHGLSIDVASGSKIAIVGPTGAGKTTIANLLMRFYEIDSGDITVDGVSIRDLSRDNVHDLFSMVLQDTWLFEGTLRENIVFTKEGVSDEELTDACGSVGLGEFLESLPEGLDTHISESSGLSVGQRQQITIARAIVKDAPMIILDEATSSVDTVTEKHIQRAMDALTTGRTSFVIAHRLSTIKNSDMILVMKDGEIVEKGTHHQLLELDGFYKQLFDSQFEGCE